MNKIYQKVLKWALKCLFSVIIISGTCSTNTFAQVLLVDPAGAGGFENGSTYAANGWTIANSGSANQWVVGNATATGMVAPFSNNKAYISSTAGASNAYDATSIAVNY